jgi:beta-barrel assembly-enhancing protease
MHYEAILLSDKIKGGRGSGKIELSQQYLHFNSEDAPSIQMPLSKLEIEHGGTGNRYVYFRHSSMPNVCIYTDSLDILKTDEIQLHAGLINQTKKIKTNRNVLNISIAFVLFLIIGLVSSAFLFRNQIVRSIAESIPPSYETKVSKSLLATTIAGKTNLNDTSILNRLAIITNLLTSAVEDTSFHFHFNIVEDPVLNAFALPGGEVVINSGLIEKSKTPEELAGVLAHEISHVTGRHHARNIIGGLSMSLIVSSFIGDVSSITAQITKAGMSLNSLKYSRDFEREADYDGFNLLVNSKINPKGMIDFFETMKKEQGKINMDKADFLSTHPGTDERIDNLKKKSVKTEESIPISINFEQFKKDIKDYFNKQ